jgi:hypothetical protein
MTVAEYIEYWRNLNGRFYDADCDGNRNNSSSLYLKDWHFVKVVVNIINNFGKY